MSESLGEREMLWEHQPQASVFTAFSRNTEYMFSISFRKQRDENKENNLPTLIIKM